jgi:hypothetical protein
MKKSRKTQEALIRLLFFNKQALSLTEKEQEEKGISYYQ